MQLASINIKVVCSNLAYGEVYSIQHYVVTCGRSVVFSTNKTDCYDIRNGLIRRGMLYSIVDYSAYHTYKLECFFKEWQHFCTVIVVDWNAKEVSFLNKWRPWTTDAHI